MAIIEAWPLGRGMVQLDQSAVRVDHHPRQLAYLFEAYHAGPATLRPVHPTGRVLELHGDRLADATGVRPGDLDGHVDAAVTRLDFAEPVVDARVGANPGGFEGMSIEIRVLFDEVEERRLCP